MYNKYYPPPQATAEITKFELRLLETDDYGSFWKSDDAQATLDYVKSLSAQKNTLAVMFVHGWHHNASTGDPNLLDSIAAMNDLADELNTQERRTLRENQTGQQDVHIVAIYVGWRGKSLPLPADYLTFWGRKAAAERAGEGDFSEFLQRMQSIYVDANALGGVSSDKSQPAAKRPYMGLITIGHSFGAQVLWKSLARQLESPLVQTSPCLTDRLRPIIPPAPQDERVALDSLGDLNILINPAFEAYQFARVDALYKQVRFLPAQTPQVVVFSADNDEARKIWFPLGRAATSPFRPNFRSDGDDMQGTLWGHALGEVETQMTHVLYFDRSAPDSLTQTDYSDHAKIINYDFTSETVFNGIHLSPIDNVPAQVTKFGAHAASVPYSPVMVIRTTGDSNEKIIDGHDGIFSKPFREFLARYISFIEGKRLILWRQNIEKGVEPSTLKFAASPSTAVLAMPRKQPASACARESNKR